MYENTRFKLGALANECKGKMKINDSKRQIVLQVEMDKTKEQPNSRGGAAAADGLTVTIAAAVEAVAAVRSEGSITN